MGEPSRLGRYAYEPVMAIGTCRASRSDAIGLAFRGLVLGEVQGRQPASGTLVRLGDRPCKVKLAARYKQVRKIVEVLKGWTGDPAGEPPPVILNKHCPACPFRDACLQQAENALPHRIGDRMPIVASRGCYQTSEAHDGRPEDQQADQERVARTVASALPAGRQA